MVISDESSPEREIDFLKNREERSALFSGAGVICRAFRSFKSHRQIKCVTSFLIDRLRNDFNVRLRQDDGGVGETECA